MIDYAGRIKAADPSALVVGPEEWGWSGYVLSGYDQQYGALNGWGNLPDRTQVMNGMDYLPWLLSQWKSAGLKPIDVFSVHYYPQGRRIRRRHVDRDAAAAEPVHAVAVGSQLRRRDLDRRQGSVDPALEAVGCRATTTRARRRRSPSTTGGAESHINGATTQADILGIFGREGLDMATRWTTPAASTPTYKQATETVPQL